MKLTGLLSIAFSGMCLRILSLRKVNLKLENEIAQLECTNGWHEDEYSADFAVPKSVWCDKAQVSKVCQYSFNTATTPSLTTSCSVTGAN